MMKIQLLLCFLPLSIYAQDITGVWKGYLKTPGNQLSYELAISQSNDKLNGYSLIVYVNDGIENTGIKSAKLKRKNRDISFEDGELVYDNFTSPGVRSKMFASLLLQIKDSLMILTGKFYTRSLDMRDRRTYSGEIYLEKEKPWAVSRMLSKLEELNLLHTLSFMNVDTKKKTISNKPVADSLITKNNVAVETIKAKPRIMPRKTEKIRDIIFSEDSLVLSVFDNGTIDGDTISLLLNGKIIADKIGLSSRAFKITIPVSVQPGDSLQLVMYAENLGSIPPNTGLLTIEEGNNRYDIRFEGNLQKSPAITLKKRTR
jgi:hypothetical protein